MSVQHTQHKHINVGIQFYSGLRPIPGQTGVAREKKNTWHSQQTEVGLSNLVNSIKEGYLCEHTPDTAVMKSALITRLRGPPSI